MPLADGIPLEAEAETVNVGQCIGVLILDIELFNDQVVREIDIDTANFDPGGELIRKKSGKSLGKAGLNLSTAEDEVCRN